MKGSCSAAFRLTLLGVLVVSALAGCRNIPPTGAALPVKSGAGHTGTPTYASMPPPSPSASTSQSAPKGCASHPESCGYPGPGNTGVPAGTELRTVPTQVSKGTGWHWDPRGWLAVDTKGAVLSDLYVHGTIEVTASNVTIADVRVSVGGSAWGIGLRHTSNVTISGCEIYSPDGSGPNRLEVGIKDINGDAVKTTIQRTNIWHTSTGIQISAGLIEDDYIHDLGYVAGDHLNGITSNAGRADGLTIDHNTVLDQMDQTDAISLFEDFGPQYDAVIENNLMAGGSYTLYGGANSGGQPTSNIRITGNRFARVYFPRGGVFGPIAAFDPAAPGNVWRDNVWDDTGKAVSAP